MPIETFTDGPRRAFKAEVAADLAGKEGYVVEMVANKETVQLFNGGIPIGVLEQRMQGSEDWTVRLLGKGGTLKVKAGGAIATPAYVKPANGGKVVAAAQGNLAIGVKVSPAAAAADGDVIEIVDVFVTMP